MSRGGAHRGENVGMSNRNPGESPGRRKPKVSSAMAIIGGLGGPKDNPALSDRYKKCVIFSLMFFVYVLKKKDSRLLYVGYTKNLRRRLLEHRKDKWKNYNFVYCEAYVYVNEKDAKKREQQLKKYGAGLGHIRNRLHGTLKDNG